MVGLRYVISMFVECCACLISLGIMFIIYLALNVVILGEVKSHQNNRNTAKVLAFRSSSANITQLYVPNGPNIWAHFIALVTPP